MMGLLRLVLSAAVGAAVALALPRAGVIAATQEVLAFLALLMAGLLPAMILTATILRAGRMSAKRVDEYGGALRLQLRFWAGLFLAAGVAALGIALAKVYSADHVSVHYVMGSFKLDEKSVTAIAVGLAGAGLGVVLQRTVPAYEGLVSLLDLNLLVSREEAQANDRAAADAVEAHGRQSAGPSTYGVRRTA